jgi:hypothetical protein
MHEWKGFPLARDRCGGSSGLEEPGRSASGVDGLLVLL